MPGPIDDTLKHLTEWAAPDWVVRGGWPAAPASLIDADIATVTGATDKVLRVSGTLDWLLAIDFHAGHDVLAKLPDLLVYNSALYRRHGLQVRSLLVLLHRGADSPQLTGVYERGFPDEPADVTLRYRVLRVWQVPAAEWLAGGLGLVPLAPLGQVAQADLPAVIARMRQRFEHEAGPQTAELWSAVYILMGLRYDQALIQKLLQGVASMRESVTYQAILKEGVAEGLVMGVAQGEAAEARRILLLLGRSRFGEPSPEAVAAINALTDLQKLEELSVRLLQANSWDALLRQTTSKRPRRGRNK